MFRIVVDTDANVIYTRKAPPRHRCSVRCPRTRELTLPKIFVVADGDSVFFLQGRGAITRPRMIKAIEARARTAASRVALAERAEQRAEDAVVEQSRI